MSLPKNKFILDATAGFRMMWFNKKHPNAIYLDIRPECEPDIVGDFRDLKQFPDETFRLVVFDPPHLLSAKNGNPLAHDMGRRFGCLHYETWPLDLKRGLDECWRVLKPFGVLILKWNDARLPSNRIIDLAPEKPLFYQISSVRHKKGSKSGSAEIRTLWFCFMKIPEQPKEPARCWWRKRSRRNKQT